MMYTAWLLPRWLVYFVAIRLWSFATTGKYGNTIAPEITMDEVLRRWEKQ